ncbi:hypothetical protein DSO57_1003683 [Entomophthora muscae]|uniref:Uncharacterized protein n=1 Tax=Entomophthora muscae TaxID=34485 RepID=A0ACC2U6G7_9FUNG|nr:hypothetical protein DSO57_1003683 [Entomophthora muscae]
MYYDALKLHVTRHVNLDQVTNLQSLYRKAEKAEQTYNTLHKAQTGKPERPKDSHTGGYSTQPPPGSNGNNTNHKPTSSNGHGNGNNGQSNCTCGVPVHQSPKCVLDHSQGPAGRDCNSLGSKWAFIHSQKEDPLRKLLVYSPVGQGNNMGLPILRVLQQYLGLLLLGLGLLHLSLGLLLLILGLLHNA